VLSYSGTASAARKYDPFWSAPNAHLPQRVPREGDQVDAVGQVIVAVYNFHLVFCRAMVARRRVEGLVGRFKLGQGIDGVEDLFALQIEVACGNKCYYSSDPNADAS
jgi:hypothetical protein